MGFYVTHVEVCHGNHRQLTTELNLGN